MEPSKEGKRNKDRTDDDDERRKEKKSKRARSRSRTPERTRERDSRRKRRHSRSLSPDKYVKKEKQNERPKEVRPEPPTRKVKETDMLNTRTGGAYIPPARLRMMQAQITDKSSIAYQRLAWEALKKSIHGHINKINVGNIGIIIKELLKENIVRGRGLLCRSVIQAQAASPTFTNVYAALVAAVNSRFPNIGELLLKRLVIQFKRGFKRNDKSICISAASFIAHLVNQRVAHEILALELLTLLVETPSDDSVEVAIAFLKESGQKLTEVSAKGVNAIFEMMRNILHEGQLDKRVQYMIEVMFQIWKDGFKDHPAVLEELELVPEEEQFTHLLMLDDATDPQDILNVFKHDEKYEENEQKYKTLCKEILGSDAESEEGSGESGSEEDDEEEEEDTELKEMTIIDNTETNLVALRRTIYLTINSSLDFEECAHKLMKMQLKPGQEVELCHMFLDCCAEQRTYEKFYGLLAQRFCNLNRIYIGPFEEIFKDSYGTAHRLDTNRLRNVSKFFAHLLFTDSISWEVLECVRLNEEDTTSSSRIYIKILFQELAEYMGLKKLNDRLKDPTLQGAFLGVFPRDNPKNTRFSINFFTTIGLGGLTDELREHLKQIPKNVLPPPEINLESASSSDPSSSSSSSDSESSSDSNEDSSKKKKQKKKSKKDTKSKSPKTPEEEPNKSKDKERWGHDGFYDNYGKEARRFEQTQERDDEKFVIPQRPRRNDKRNQNEDSRRDERRQKDDERNDGSHDRERNREDRNRGRRSDKDDERHDRERDNRDKRSDRERNTRDERPDRERNNRDERSDKERNTRDERPDKERNTRDERPDRERNNRDERPDRERNNRDEKPDNERNTRDERPDKERNTRHERPDKERNNRDERPDKERNNRDERPDRERNNRDESPDKERNTRDERPDRERNNRDERPDKVRNNRDERPDRERNTRNERPDKERNTRDERPDRERNNRDERPDKEKNNRDERPDRERNNRVERPDRERNTRDERPDRERNTRDERPDREKHTREKNNYKDDERNDKEVKREGSDRGDKNKNTEDQNDENRHKERKERSRDEEKNSDQNQDRESRDKRRKKEKRSKDDERQDGDGAKLNKKSSKRDRNSETIGSDEEIRRDRDRGDKDTKRGRDDRREDMSSRVDEAGIRWEINGEYKKQNKKEGKSKKSELVQKAKEQSDFDSSDSDDSSSTSSSSSSSSSSSEDSGSREDGWDIQVSSLGKEIVGRYWDMPDIKRETVERSPARETRRDR